MKKSILKESVSFDFQREERTGIPEVVLAEFKPLKILTNLLSKVAQEKGKILATRVPLEYFPKLRKALSTTLSVYSYPEARAIIVKKKGYQEKEYPFSVGLISAGTSDLQVAEEARVTAKFLGYHMVVAYDVGIAGHHRIFEPVARMKEEKVVTIIVVAGMEGALPGVVKSLVAVPVIAVPTSVGYGVGKGGQAALFSMLQSCSPGMGVVNIDNGFGAAVLAFLIGKVSINK
jgi:hypothetical protein